MTLATILLLLAADGPRIKLPPPDLSPPKPNAPKVIPQPAAAKFNVPPGFQVTKFADGGFKKPRILLELADTSVLVSDQVEKGSVILIAPDKSRKALLTGLDRPFGLAYHQGYLYVSEATAIQRYKFDEKTKEIGPAAKIVPLDGYGKGHVTRSLAFGKDGRLYVSIGSGSNVDPGDPKDRAAINIYNADGTGHDIMATGLRNPVGIRFHPTSGKLWTTCQERDGLGDELAPDFLTEVKPGAFYGWPYAYVGPNPEPRRKGEADDLVKKTIEPDVVLPAHVAVMDLTFYSGKMFPAKYRNGAFLAYRGSSGKAKRVGYSVVFVPFNKKGKPTGPPEDFLTGFMLGQDQKEVWGRPVGLTQLRDGSLLLSEDGNNTVWKISYSK